MNINQIKEAINAHDPDGSGLERVLVASRATLENGYDAGPKGLFNNDSQACLLKHAWDVSYCDKNIYGRTNSEELPHSYSEVVSWFDSLEAPATTIYNLLSPDTNGYVSLMKFKELITA